MQPKVTIIMATYNRAHFIEETLYSVQNQTFKDWECIIIDDGGIDNTKKVITSILEQDCRFKYIKRTEEYKKGLSGCRNYGLDLANGEYIIFFDDDDIVHPDNLKIGIEVIKKKNIDFCHYQKQSFQNKKPTIKDTKITVIQSISRDEIEEIITQKIGFASCTVLWKKKCFDSIRFKESLLYAEEWECYSKIISENFKGIMISNILYYNRKHSDSNTGEFYTYNPIRRESYVVAILLVMQNLKEKQLLSISLKRYFIVKSLGFKEYDLFEKILKIIDFTAFEKLKWTFFYKTLPLRMYGYRIKKVILKKHLF